MNCPHCQVACNSVVLETRKQEGSIIRKRACGHCGRNFCSREVPDTSVIMKRGREAYHAAARAGVEPGPKVTSLDAFRAWR